MDKFRFEFEMLLCKIGYNECIETEEYRINKIDDNSISIEFNTLNDLNVYNDLYMLFELIDEDINNLVLTYRIRKPYINFDELECITSNEIYRDLYSINVDIGTKQLIMLLSQFPLKLIKSYVGDLDEALKDKISEFLKIKFD